MYSSALFAVFISQLILSGALSDVEFLGAGYDALKGNPHTNYRDPGFRQSVLKIQNHEATSNGSDMLLYPGMQLLTGKLSCSYYPVVDTVNNSASYINILSRDAIVHGSEFAEKFSDNDLFIDLKIDTSDYGRKYVVSVAKCSVYEAYFDRHGTRATHDNPKVPFVLTEAFSSAVADLPIVGGKSKYRQFIDTFGTHYVGRVRAGAKAVWLNAFEQSTWLALGDAGFNFSAAASASFIASTGGRVSLSEAEVQLKNTSEENVSYVRNNYIGSLPSGDGNCETWAKLVEISPQPIEYDVYPLTDLLTTELFPHIAPETLLSITLRLTALFHKTTNTKIWKVEGGTGRRGRRATEGNTRTCLSMLELNAEFTGTVKLSCPPRHTVLSCGISNTQYATHEAFRHTIPISSSSCECYDRFGASCHARCSDAAPLHMYVAMSGLQSGTINVNCPSGYKVAGCHTSSPTSVTEDQWRSHYPNADGNGCTCIDKFGTNCYASCINNVASHTVRSASGSHVVTVTCGSTEMYVLGCGIKSDSTKTAEHFRMVYVSGRTSCTCYDYFGTTCYAICGKFV